MHLKSNYITVWTVIRVISSCTYGMFLSSTSKGQCCYDGGDCCGYIINIGWCEVCACLDPNGSGDGTTCAPTTTTTVNPGNYAPALNC